MFRFVKIYLFQAFLYLKQTTIVLGTERRLVVFSGNRSSIIELVKKQNVDNFSLLKRTHTSQSK